MYEISYGPKAKETKDLSKVQIAARIREDIKAAVKAGKLPRVKAVKYSVKTSLYAGGGSINIRVKGFKWAFKKVHNPARIKWESENPHKSIANGPSEIVERYSPEVDAFLATLKEIHAAYNYDGSDIQSDYFNVRYYGDVSLDWKEVDETKAAELAALTSCTMHEDCREHPELGAACAASIANDNAPAVEPTSATPEALAIAERINAHADAVNKASNDKFHAASHVGALEFFGVIDDHESIASATPLVVAEEPLEIGGNNLLIGGALAEGIVDFVDAAAARSKSASTVRVRLADKRIVRVTMHVES